jgi:hypothetical protein
MLCFLASFQQRDHLPHAARPGVNIVQPLIWPWAIHLVLPNGGPTAAQLEARCRQLLHGGLDVDQVDVLLGAELAAQLDPLLSVRSDDVLGDFGTARSDDLPTALEAMEAILGWVAVAHA